MSTLMSELKLLPPDPLLGLMTRFKADPRPHKVDLGVGVYRDSEGNTPVMGAVREAEERLLRKSATKTYEGPRGNLNFCAAIEDLVLPDLRGNLASFATPGGCGAIYAAISLARKMSPEAVVWISHPSWPNHEHIARSAGLDVQFYRYADTVSSTSRLHEMQEDLGVAKPGDVLILQGPCHNPSGIDLSAAQWRQLAELVQQKKLITLVDIAYHGLGMGLDEDLEPIRRFLSRVSVALVSYSCSKNFGLYRERTGALAIKATDSGSLQAATSQIASLTRAAWSMPPAHGAAIVDEILSDNTLTRLWEDELYHMRERLKCLRRRFTAALVDHTGNDSLERLSGFNGMFSRLPLSPHATRKLMADHAIYIPESGRINFAGLSEGTVESTARKIAQNMEPQGDQ